MVPMALICFRMAAQSCRSMYLTVGMNNHLDPQGILSTPCSKFRRNEAQGSPAGLALNPPEKLLGQSGTEAAESTAATSECVQV